MAGRALLAGYPRIASRYNSTQLYLFGTKPFSQISSEWLSSRKNTSLKFDSLIFLKNAFQKQNVNTFFCGEANVLIHWGHEKNAAILQMTFSNSFNFMKMLVFWFKSSLKFIPEGPIKIFQHWFRWWIGADQVTSHHFDQWWPGLQNYVWVTQSQWVNSLWPCNTVCCHRSGSTLN